MKRRSFIAAGLSFAAAATLGTPVSGQSGWTVLFDGKNLDNWNPIGNANWRLEQGSVVADKGVGFLVSKSSYTDFEIKAEFWADDAANSGIFIRCSDPQKINAENSYEVNIYDGRPDPSYGTGAIVNFAKVSPMPKAGGKWNTFEITARGTQLIVVMNGTKTVDIHDSKFASGSFALQYGAGVGGAGVIKWRKVEIRTL
jgi:hypothetical protein